jgi:hypothetical protein
VPASKEPIFWTISCGYSARRSLEELLFRVPPIVMSVHEIGGGTSMGRVSQEVLTNPVLGTRNWFNGKANPPTLSIASGLMVREFQPIRAAAKFAIFG